MVSIKHSLIGMAMLGLLVTTSGCGMKTSLIKPSSESNPIMEKESYTQVDTLRFLPSQGYDKEGNKLPYQQQSNPYLAQKGQIPQAQINLYIAAVSAYRRDHLELARTKLEQLAEMTDELSGPWVKLGQVAKKEGKIDEAEDHFRKALQVNEENVNAYIELALILREQGKFIAAQNIYAQALKIWPDFPEAHLNLGVLYDLYLNQPENAQAHYEAYLFLTQYKNDDVKNWLAEVKTRTGIYESFVDTPPLPDDADIPEADSQDVESTSTASL